MAKQSRSAAGQGLVEYALILVLVAVVVIVILLLLGPSISNIFTEFVDSINGTPAVTPTINPTATPSS
ncbi:MAG: Flp family type IVb pilin [Chloroflexi bacterium]|nr:Flp family type IVb pilin [Chloroflexota bacterium]MCY3582370.1 Flp family type IVb pilin [Chloroflexota bacterium]MCY3717080.1 Flp family type IVb pilin [Chloroflexota bacterium]MDE2650784.1 Flp family type IVb pilin [Chloroflexota bacterium]MXX50752.1 hypothetical protein [Chloroflexota bacterium]